MTVLDAILLGLLQALTEFLPISSSGHLVLGQHFLGLTEPQVFFDVMLHLGTVAAVVVVYRADLVRLGAAALSALASADFYRSPLATVAANPDLRLIWFLVLGSIPAAVIGHTFQDQLEALFARPRVVAVMLMVTGVILQLPALRRRPAKLGERMRWWQAPVVGLAQALAIIPGISRSGTTISTGLLTGMVPQEAARFSFLLSIPAIVGASLLKMGDAEVAVNGVATLVAGVLTSFVVGWAALKLLLEVLRMGRLGAFSYYCWAVGIAALVALSL